MGCCKKTKVDIALSKVKSIVRGWSGIVWSSEEVKCIAYARIEICAKCDKNINNFCKDCGCWIPAKARSLDEKCDKWIDD